MRLILIRHGESDHVIRNVIAEQVSCRGLAERGFKQAELLAQRFAVTHEVSDCQVLLCSPVLRARQTSRSACQDAPCWTHRAGLRPL